MKWLLTEPRYGDMVRVKSGTVYHYGVYVSDDEVIQFGLAPAAIAHALANEDAEALSELMVTTCMLCGCCSFVCPANRPLVQNNKLAKAFLQEAKAKGDVK